MRKLLDPIYQGFLTQKAREHYLDAVRRYAIGATVLEIGAGDILMAGNAVKSIADSVCAMDIQYPENSESESNGIVKLHGNIEKTDFPDNHFGLICGSGVLHHSDLKSSLPEIARILVTNGTIAFYEPTILNPLVNIFRRLTPAIRDTDEYPFTLDDIHFFNDFFEEVSYKIYFKWIVVIEARKQC